MDKWADEGIEPPASNYPSLSNGTLVSLQQAAASFPVIPEVSFPTVYDTYELLVFGPLFNSLGGILTIQPPLNGPGYAIRLPKTDSDGYSLQAYIKSSRAYRLGLALGGISGRWRIEDPISAYLLDHTSHLRPPRQSAWLMAIHVRHLKSCTVATRGS